MTMNNSLNTALAQSNFDEKLQKFLNESITKFLRHEINPHQNEYKLNVDINIKFTDSSKSTLYCCDDLSFNVSNSNFNKNEPLQKPIKLTKGIEGMLGITIDSPERHSNVPKGMNKSLSRGLDVLLQLD